MNTKIYLTLISIIIFYSTAISQSVELKWANALTGSGYTDFGTTITTDNADNVYVMGTFWGEIDLDPGQGTYPVQDYNGDNLFIQKYNSNGNLIWVKTFPSDNSVDGYSLNVDNLGNVYAVGTFHGPTDFDPGPGQHIILTSDGSHVNNEIFILKLDNNGNLAWVTSMGSDDDDYGLDMVIDIDGNLLFTGYFTEEVDFDPGPSEYFLSSNSTHASDAFLLKLTPSGDFVWAKSFGSGENTERGQSIATDAVGNIYFSGHFYNTMDADPGPSVYEITANDNSDIFVIKLDANGDFTWAKAFGGELNEETNEIIVNNMGEVHLTGYFESTMTFGNDMLSSAGDKDIFIGKLNSNGDPLWVTSLGATSEDVGNSITLDTEGDVYVTGSFSETVDFNPGNAVANSSSNGASDMFALKLDASGNFISNFTIGSWDTDFGMSVHVDTGNDLYITGGFSYTCDFDPGMGTFNLASGNEQDVFILKFGQTGTTDIQETQLSNIHVYPNPISEVLNIDLENNYKEIDVKIIDSQGKLISQTRYNETNYLKFDTKIWHNGLYLIQLNIDGTSKTFKAIKN